MASGRNMFLGFDSAAKQREQEQASVAAMVTGAQVPQSPMAQAEPKGKITLSITDADRLKVKSYALQHGTTVSDLLHDWIAKL